MAVRHAKFRKCGQQWIVVFETYRNGAKTPRCTWVLRRITGEDREAVATGQWAERTGPTSVRLMGIDRLDQRILDTAMARRVMAREADVSAYGKVCRCSAGKSEMCGANCATLKMRNRRLRKQIAARAKRLSMDEHVKEIDDEGSTV